MTELLVADIGGTGSRLALVSDGDLIADPVCYQNSDYPSFDAVLEDFLGRNAVLPGRAALAVAGPVANNQVYMTNLGWSLSAVQLSAESGIQQVEIINDFAALAWATLELDMSGLYQIGRGTAQEHANRGIIGPGTGLGVSGLIYGDDGWSVMAGEGGHVTISATTHAEAEMIGSVAREFGHCSAERLISGPGLVRIYTTIGGEECPPEQVTERALAGDALAGQAIEIFCCLLGTVASNLALTVGARGGIYLAGGILPAITGLLEESGFRKRFEAKARLQDYLAAIPTYVITQTYPSLTGLARYAAR